MQAVSDFLEIKRAILQIKIVSRGNLDAVVVQVSIEVRNSLFQRMRRVFLSKGCSHDPQAELLAFQSSFAVEDQWFGEIRQRLVEQTKECTPMHVAYYVDSGLPPLGC